MSRDEQTMPEVIRRAADELARLCAGRGRMTHDNRLAGRNWTMCSPMRDDDSDSVFADLIEAAAKWHRAAPPEDATREDTPEKLVRALRIAADVWDKPGALRNADLAELLRAGAAAIEVLAAATNGFAAERAARRGTTGAEAP